MHKMLAGKIISLVLLMIVLLGITGALQAQDGKPLIPVLFAQTDEGITFYGLDDQNALIEMGRLPEQFDLTPDRGGNRSNHETERRWLYNWWNMNVVLSPDGSQIAFTADNQIPDQDAINFYIYLYNVQSGDLQQAYTTVWSGGPRTDLYWSPDSRAILIEPAYGESPPFQPPYAESFVYYIETGHVTQLPDTIAGKTWENDSHALLDVKGYDAPILTLIDPYKNIHYEIGQVEGLSPEGVDWVDPFCEFVWSPEQQRWYFIAQCGTQITPAERVYSIELDGQVQLEADFQTYLTQELELIEDQSYIGSIDLHNLYANNGDIYITLYFYYEIYPNNNENTQGGSEWGVFKLSDDEPIETLFRFNADQTSNFTTTIPSPDFRTMAFVSDGTEENWVVIGNLVNDSVVEQSVRASWDTSGAYWRYWMGRWIDNQRFLYEDMTDVWLFDASNQSFTNLTDEIEQQAWLLPQAKSN